MTPKTLKTTWTPEDSERLTELITQLSAEIKEHVSWVDQILKESGADEGARLARASQASYNKIMLSSQAMKTFLTERENRVD